MWFLLSLALSDKGCFAFATLYDYLLLCYCYYTAAKREGKLKPPRPLPTNLSAAAVSVTLMDKIPKRSYLQNKEVFCNIKKFLLRNVFHLLKGAAGKDTVAQESWWICTKRSTDCSGEMGGNVPAIWKSLQRVIMFS